MNRRRQPLAHATVASPPSVAVHPPGQRIDRRTSIPTVDPTTWLARYRPQRLDPELWSAVRPFVVETAGRLLDAGVGFRDISTGMWALTALAVYCHQAGRSLTLATVLDPYTVDQFVAHHQATPTVQTYRSKLSRFGRYLDTTGQWEKRVQGSRRMLAPYAEAELRRLWNEIDRNEPSRRRAGQAFYLLGVAAGLTGPEAVRVRRDDVTDDGDGLLVHTRGRIVPVLARYDDELHRIWHDTADGELLIGGRAVHRDVTWDISTRLVLSPGTPRLRASRLRGTWLVTHLTLGTRLPELAEAAGLRTLTRFPDFLPYITPLHPDPEQNRLAARRMLRG